MAKENVDVDAPPRVQYDEQSWRDYYKPHNVTLLITRRRGLFTAIVGIYYLINFVMAAGAVDAYAESTRFNVCEAILVTSAQTDGSESTTPQVTLPEGVQPEG